MERSALVAFVIVLLLGLPAPGAAAEMDPAVAEPMACVKKNIPSSVKHEGRLERTDAEGHKTKREASLVAVRDEKGVTKLLLRVESPPDERGSAFLFIEREDGGYDLFSYLPELGKVRRIQERAIAGSLFGTDFSYEDWLEMQALAARAKIERLPDAEVEGRPVYVLAGTPPPEFSGYLRVVTRIDKETCVILGADMYGKPDLIAKQITVDFDDVSKHDTRWFTKRVKIRNLVTGSESELVLDKSQWNVKVPDHFFSESQLMKGH